DRACDRGSFPWPSRARQDRRRCGSDRKQSDQPSQRLGDLDGRPSRRPHGRPLVCQHPHGGQPPWRNQGPSDEVVLDEVGLTSSPVDEVRLAGIRRAFCCSLKACGAADLRQARPRGAAASPACRHGGCGRRARAHPDWLLVLDAERVSPYTSSAAQLADLVRERRKLLVARSKVRVDLPATKACSRATARRLAPSASSPSPSLESQSLQAAQTFGAKCWLTSTRGNHWRMAASKYSPALLLGLLPQTAMPIWSGPCPSERHAAATDAVRPLG